MGDRKLARKKKTIYSGAMEVSRTILRRLMRGWAQDRMSEIRKKKRLIEEISQIENAADQGQIE